MRIAVVEGNAGVHHALADRHVYSARSVTVAGHFKQQREVADTRVAHERRKAPLANGAFADVGVAVTVASEFDLRVVEVEAAKPLQAHSSVHRL